MKKDKIFELRIEDDDDISGVDQISLVDQPAIEVEWIAFRKTEFAGLKVSLDYDGVLSTQRGQNLAKKLIDDGYDVYVVSKERLIQAPMVFKIAEQIGLDKKKIFFTEGKPKWRKLKDLGITKHYDNNSSELDDIEKNAPMTVAVRFEEVAGNMDVLGYSTKYFHMCPGAQELFKHLIEMETDEDVKGMIRSAAQVADNVFKIEEEVVQAEKGSVEQLQEAKILIEDFKDIMYEIDELTHMGHDVSFMDGHLIKIAEYVDEEELSYDVSTITGYVDPGITGATMEPYMEFETYNDYPEAAKNNACKVLRWRDEHGDEVKGMTRVGWTRANQLCNGENISESTIARMSAFQRHRKNAEVAEEYKSEPWKDAGYVAWLGWGGTTGVEWASRKLESIRNQKMSKTAFATDEEKRIVLGPLMIPDKRIFRKDKKGNPYHVYFTESTIRQIANKFLKKKYVDNSDTQHNGKVEKDVYVIESWIKEDMYYDKANKYGYTNLPVGTWFGALKINNDEVWNKIKKGELKGFSVSGYFEEVEQFSQEYLFLHKVAEIIKSVEGS